jgi:GTPase SAR1 family protein
MTKLFSTRPKLFRFPHKNGIVDSKHVPSTGEEATIIYEIWDLILNERLFPGLVRIPFMVAHCVIIIFDVTNQYSFDNLDIWIKQMYKHAKDLHSVIIVGSKIDLDDKRCVSSYDAEMFAKSYGFEYREFSSKTGQGVDGILDVLGQSLLLDDPIGGVVPKETFNTHVDVDYEEKIEKEKSGLRCF